MNLASARSALYVGSMMHHRRTAPEHRFTHPLVMWLLDLDELPELPRRLAGFGRNRWRPIAFHDADHLSGAREDVADALRHIVEAAGVGWPGGPVSVLTHCRVFGYVFNPVSFWYCHAPDGSLAVIVAEVNNTFGDRHCYVSPRLGHPPPDGSMHPAWVRWRDKKLLHVSPFFPLDGTYDFALGRPGERLGAAITLRVGDEIRFDARLSLSRRPLTRTSVPRVLLRYPLMTARVTAAIHWEALRLRLKGARYRGRPPYDPDAARKGVA